MTIATTQLRIDREAGIIRNCKLGRPESNNGYTYDLPCCEKISRLSEGAGVKGGHWQQSSDKALGFIRSPRYERSTGEWWGDWHLFKSHPEYEVIMEKAEKAPSVMALSVEVPPGKFTHTYVDGKPVITDVNDDAVRWYSLELDGGMNISLFESDQSIMAAPVQGLTPAPPTPTIQTVEDFRRQHPAVASQFEHQVGKGLAEACGCDRLEDLVAERDKFKKLAEDLQAKLDAINNVVAIEERLKLTGITPEKLAEDKTKTAIKSLAAQPEAVREPMLVMLAESLGGGQPPQIPSLFTAQPQSPAPQTPSPPPAAQPVQPRSYELANQAEFDDFDFLDG